MQEDNQSNQGNREVDDNNKGSYINPEEYQMVKRFFKISRILIKDIDMNEYALFCYLKAKDSMTQ